MRAFAQGDDLHAFTVGGDGSYPFDEGWTGRFDDGARHHTSAAVTSDAHDGGLRQGPLSHRVRSWIDDVRHSELLVRTVSTTETGSAV